MKEYIIDEELRNNLIGLLILLQKVSEKTYHKYSDKYSHRLILDNGKEIKLPILKELQDKLQNLDEVIQTDEYNAKTEELLLIAKEMKLL